MARSQEDVCREIVDGTDEDRGHLIKRIRGFDHWTPERKASTEKFIMLLGLVGRIGASKPVN